jgi:hypothetical protein
VGSKSQEKKKKGEVVPVHTAKACSGSGSTAALVINIGILRSVARGRGVSGGTIQGKQSRRGSNLDSRMNT